MSDGALRSGRPWELVVLRHGRTAWNENGRFQGHTDVPLDATGRDQARGLHTLLGAERFTRAVASDLARARETAEIVLGSQGPPLEYDARWREMRFGAWEGLTWAEIARRYPAVAERSATTPKFFTPADGESFDEVCARVAAALAGLDAGAAEGDRVLLATHAGALHALLRVALGESEASALGVRFEPGSATRIAFGPDGARVVELNRVPAAAP